MTIKERVQKIYKSNLTKGIRFDPSDIAGQFKTQRCYVVQIVKEVKEKLEVERLEKEMVENIKNDAPLFWNPEKGVDFSNYLNV